MLTQMQANLLDLIEQKEHNCEITSNKASSLYLRVTMTTHKDSLLDIFDELFSEDECQKKYKLSIKEKLAIFFYKLSFKTNKPSACSSV